MITLKAPAKINLFLKIVNKRSDGYHDLYSLFQTISLFDELTLELADKDSFECSDILLQNHDNLVIKALNLFRQKSQCEFFVATHLKKSIPSQAGLGGGSSNAASMLKGLNQLLDNPLSDADLHELASQLGSDVPFFLKGGSALCEGRGEIITPITLPSNKSVWIIKPPHNLPTPYVFKNYQHGETVIRDHELSLKSHLDGKGEYYNDLEVTACRLEPALQQLKDYLIHQGFTNVVMTGSGSAFFCFGDHRPKVPERHELYECQFTS